MKISVIARCKCAWLGGAAFFCLSGALHVVRAQEGQELNRDAVVGYLNEVITWYRDATTKVQGTGLPSDAIYEDSTRNLAADVVRLAFQSARTEAALIEGNEKSHNANEST